MNRYSVAYYQTERGDKPVRDFVQRQDSATRSKIDRFISLLKANGPDLGMPHARYLKSNLYELRIRGKNEVRIFYVAMLEHDVIMFVHAFKKRTQKLPTKELDIARKRQRELTGI